jgi:hypothetical protein
MAIEILDGGLATKDPSDVAVYEFNWDRNNLASSVTISSSAFTLTVLKPVSGDATLTKDSESILSGSRKTQLRLTGGAVGTLARVDNRIVTNESPAQTKERHFLVKIEQK